jgi:hypothetical protein
MIDEILLCHISDNFKNFIRSCYHYLCNSLIVVAHDPVGGDSKEKTRPAEWRRTRLFICRGEKIAILLINSQNGGLPEGDLNEKACHSLRSFSGLIFPYAYENKFSMHRKNKALPLSQKGFFICRGENHLTIYTPIPLI